jgi:site-specific recombinase XerD
MKWNEVEKRMQDVARLRHLAYSTERSYITWAKQYAKWLAKQPAAGEAREKVERFLTGMARSNYSAISQNQAFSALLFLYRDCLGQKLENVDALRAKTPQRERYAPTFDEMKAMLAEVKDSGGYPVRLAVQLIYGCGMRVSEPLNLRLKDVCLVDSRITKGAKDRVVPLPCSLAKAMEIQMARAAAVAERDVLDGIPVQLPDRLDVKYPRLAFCKEWAFVFPGHNPCIHPRTGKRVRYRMLEENVQRAVRAAGRRLGLNPMITPHCFRHAYATHLMKAGTSVRDVQVLMGHRSLETTMGYLHVEADRTVSPIESMGLCPA